MIFFKLLVIGKLPPPIGGVTIHVQRLLDHLETNEIDYSFYDLSKFSLISFINTVRKHKYAHLHSSSPKLKLLFSAICTIVRTKSMMTIHGNLGRFDRINNQIDRLAFTLCNYPIVLNKQSYAMAQKFNANTQLLSAYLSPVKKTELPAGIIEMLQKVRNTYRYVVATNAYAKVYDKNNDEIYGVDFLIDFFKTMPHYALIISDPSGDYNRSQLANFENIKIIGCPHPFVNVLEYADIYIRNTTTDGDSISIHEATDVGVSIIATDVVDRPENVHLIKRGDPQSLHRALSIVKEQKTEKMENRKIPEIITFYKNLFDNNQNEHEKNHTILFYLWFILYCN
jgi:hypothetical protein